MSAAGLDAVGLFSYNEISIGGAERLTVKAAPVYDDAGRTVSYVTYTITVTGIIVPTGLDETTDNAIDALRDGLMTPGQRLIVKTKGFGTLDVNAGGLVQDVAWGPKPVELSIEPIGSNKAMAVTFTITTSIPACPGGTVSTYTGIMAGGYTVQIAVNEFGLITRTITGYILIAQTRVGGMALESADAYLDKVQFDAMPGYKRTHTRTISQDRNRLDFTITDSQIASRNPYPKGAAAIKGTHTVSWTRGAKQSAKMRNAMALELTPKCTLDAEAAYLMMLGIIAKRRKAAKVTILESLEIRENLFGLPVSVSAVWTTLGKVDQIAKITGLFTRADDTTWKQHVKSMEDAQRFGGASNYTDVFKPELLIDLCTPESDQGSTTDPLEPRQDQYRKDNVTDSVKNYQPSSEESWVQFDEVYFIHGDTWVSVHVPVQKSGGPVPNDITQPTNPNFDVENPNNDNGTAADLLQRPAKPTYRATVMGAARRAGHPIPKPTRTTIGKANAVELRHKFSMNKVDELFGVPVYQAQWAIEYALDQQPGEIDAPADIQQLAGAPKP